MTGLFYVNGGSIFFVFVLASFFERCRNKTEQNFNGLNLCYWTWWYAVRILICYTRVSGAYSSLISGRFIEFLSIDAWVFDNIPKKLNKDVLRISWKLEELCPRVFVQKLCVFQPVSPTFCFYHSTTLFHRRAQKWFFLCALTGSMTCSRPAFGTWPNTRKIASESGKSLPEKTTRTSCTDKKSWRPPAT